MKILKLYRKICIHVCVCCLYKISIDGSHLCRPSAFQKLFILMLIVKSSKRYISIKPRWFLVVFKQWIIAKTSKLHRANFIFPLNVSLYPLSYHHIEHHHQHPSGKRKRQIMQQQSSSFQIENLSFRTDKIWRDYIKRTNLSVEIVYFLFHLLLLYRMLSLPLSLFIAVFPVPSRTASGFISICIWPFWSSFNISVKWRVNLSSDSILYVKMKAFRSIDSSGEI